MLKNVEFFPQTSQQTSENICKFTCAYTMLCFNELLFQWGKIQ